MVYALDGAVILILLVCLLWGYHRGFVKTAVKTIGCVAAIVLAFVFSSVVAETVFDMVIEKPLKEYTSEQVLDTAGEALETQVELIVADLPEWTKTVLSNMGYTSAEDVMQQWNPDADATAEQLVDALIRPPLVAVLRLIAFLILFIVLMVVVSLLSKVAKQIFRLPILRQLDKTLGIVTGAVQGVLWIVGLATVLQLYVSLAGADSVVTQEMLRDTTLVRIVMDINPVTAAVQTLFGA